MSDQENNPSQEQPVSTPQVEQPAGTAPQPESAPAASKKVTGFSDVHTPDNTPMKEVLPSRPDVNRVATEEDKEGGMIPIFLGNRKEDMDKANELLQKWLQRQAIEDMWRKQETTESVYNSAKNEWQTFIEAEFPERSLEAVEEYCSSLLRFFQSFQDTVRIRSKVLNEENVSNLSSRGRGPKGDVVTGDLIPKKPSAASKGFSLSEMMLRSSIRSEQGDYQFDLMLRDSYTFITTVRPNKLDLASLINDINRTVKGYVRTVGENSTVLAHIAGAKVIWDFIAQRIVSCSVTGLIDFNDLARVIRLSDFQAICMMLLRATTNSGVNLDLRCLSRICDWHEADVVDPEALLRIRHSVHTPEDYAIYGNLMNGKVKYTVDETLALINKANYGLESNRVYNEDSSICFEVGSPSLAEAFETFDYYSSRVNQQLTEIRQKVIDQADYEQQVAIHFATLGATEFLHWIRAYVILAKPDTDEEDTVIRRSENDPAEFNKGCFDVIMASPSFNKSLTAFILNKVPYMSHTFVGVANSVCPKCKTPASDHVDVERFMGYTPIDAFMAFFTHTRLRLMSQAAETVAAREEAISE